MGNVLRWVGAQLLLVVSVVALSWLPLVLVAETVAFHRGVA